MNNRRWFRARRVSPRALVMLGALGLATTALAGPVRGKIAGADKLIPSVYADMAKAEHRYTWREPSPTVKPEFRVLSANPSRDICIAAIAPTAAPAHEAIQITVTGGHTVPTTIAVSPQTKLLFVNHDPFPHRLYLVGDNSFKEMETSTGGSRDWTAPGTGKFEFRDKLTPTLRFYVVIDPGVVDVVYPGHNGAFAFRNLASGDYFLKAYFDGKEVGSVQAVARGGTVDLHEPLTLHEAK